MMPTPTVAAMATVSAAMATPVRLRFVTTPRAAMRPMTPARRPSRGRAVLARPTTASGVRRAAPTSRQKSAPYPAQMLCCVAASRSVPPPAISTPAPAHHGAQRRRAVSCVERRRTVLTGAFVASRAGGRAASSVVPIPNSAPFASVQGATVTSRTSTTKYRSLIVWARSCTSPDASTTPSSTPSTLPTRPSAAASPSTSRKTCPRVTPRARRRPSRPRRCTIENVMVL
jgi:hypothetical protein